MSVGGPTFANFYKVQEENESAFYPLKVTSNSFSFNCYVVTYGEYTPSGQSTSSYMQSPYVGLLASTVPYYLGFANYSNSMSTSNIFYSSISASTFAEDTAKLYHPLTTNEVYSKYYETKLTNTSNNVGTSAIKGNTKYYLYAYVLPSTTDLSSYVSNNTLNFYNVYSSWESIYRIWSLGQGSYYQQLNSNGYEVITLPSEYASVTVNSNDIEDLRKLKTGQTKEINYTCSFAQEGSEVRDIKNYFRYKYSSDLTWSSWKESKTKSSSSFSCEIPCKRGETLKLQFSRGNTDFSYSQTYYEQNAFLSSSIEKSFSIPELSEDGSLKTLETPEYTVEFWNSRLSDEANYQFVEYLENTYMSTTYNKGYIDFEKTFNELMFVDVDITISFTSSSSSSPMTLFGTYSNGNYGYCILAKRISSTQKAFALYRSGSMSSATFYTVSIKDNEKIKVSVKTPSSSQAELYINDQLLISSGFSLGSHEYTKVTLFSVLNFSQQRYSESGVYDFVGKVHNIRIKSTKSSQDFEYVFNPCYRKQDNMPGLYDVRHRVFYEVINPNVINTKNIYSAASSAGITANEDASIYDSSPTVDSRSWVYTQRNWSYNPGIAGLGTYKISIVCKDGQVSSSNLSELRIFNGTAANNYSYQSGILKFIEKKEDTFEITSTATKYIEYKPFDAVAYVTLRKVLSPENMSVKVGDKSAGGSYGRLVDISNIAISDLSITKERNIPDILSTTIEYVQFKKKLEDENTKITDVLKPYLVDVVVKRNFEIIFTGILMYAKATLSAVGRQALEIKAVGYGEELNKRYINCSYGDMNYPQIASNIIYDAQHEMNWIDNYDFLSEQTDSGDENDTSYFNGWRATDPDSLEYIPIKTPDSNVYLAHWQNGSISFDPNCEFKCFKLTCSQLKGANRWSQASMYNQYLKVEFWHCIDELEQNTSVSAVPRTITMRLEIDTDGSDDSTNRYTSDFSFESKPSGRRSGAQWTKFSAIFNLHTTQGFVKHLSLKNTSAYRFYINDINIYRPSDEEQRTNEINAAATSAYDLNLKVGYFDPAFSNREIYPTDRVRHYHRVNAKEALYNIAKLQDQNFEFSVDKDGNYILKQAEGDLVVRNVATWPGQISEISIERDADTLYNVGHAVNTHLFDNSDLILNTGQAIQYADLTNGTAIDEESCAKYKARVQIVQVDTTTRREIETEAQGAIHASDEVQDIPTLKFDSNIYNPGNVHIGDAFGIQVDIDDIFNFINGEYRVYGYDLRVSTDHVERMDITLCIPTALQLQLMTFPVTMKNMMNNIKRLQIKSNK